MHRKEGKGRENREDRLEKKGRKERERVTE